MQFFINMREAIINSLHFDLIIELIFRLNYQDLAYNI